MKQPPEELARKRRNRNRALLAVLVGLVILFYFITMVRMREADEAAHGTRPPAAAPVPATPPRP